MARLIEQAKIIPAAGTKGKLIEEFIGRVVNGTNQVSIARMTSPEGWEEPGQTPEFDEYTLVLDGTLKVETTSGPIDVHVGQAVHAPKGEWVRYASPYPGGAKYVAMCIPAFSPDIVHREE